MGHSHGSREGGGVLVHIEIVVEMRDSRPFHANLRIGHHIRPIILAVQVIIDLRQGFCRQALPLLGHPVGDHLIFREHGLAVHGPLEAVQIMVQQESPFFLVRGVGQQIFHQQDLVAGGSHFRHEDPVTGVHGRLAMVGVPGVHGVAQLMDQGEQIVHIACIVQQDIGIAVIGSGGVGAAALAFILVHVNPAVGEALPDYLQVVLSQRSQGLQDRLFGFGERNLLGNAGDNGGVDVVHMQFVHTQQTFAQTHIAVHLVQVLIDGFNQVPVHLGGDVHSVHGRLQGIFIMAGLGVENQLLDMAAVDAGQGVGILFVDAVELFKGLPADPAVCRFLQRHEAPLADLHHLAVFIFHFGKRQVRVVEDGVGLVGIAADLGGVGQQFFHLLGQNMGLQAQGILQIDPILLQLGALPVVVLQPGGLQLQNLGGDERNGAPNAGSNAAEALVHLLVGVVACILVAEAGYVYAQMVQLAVQGRLLAQGVKKASGAFAYMPFLIRQLFAHLPGLT